MNISIDQTAEDIMNEMRKLGIEAFEAKQKATNPTFYKSGLNEMPDLSQLSRLNKVQTK